ncbi:MAG: hypothetical protein M3Y57_15460 [Acidobacteriota bacterium]|nr:hypothetical protein [Acidobacteriota bacterium]
MDQDSLFAADFNEAGLEIEFDDEALTRVTLPHCVTALSWQNWNPVTWEKVCLYRRHFALPREFNGHRVFIHFDHVMAAATPVVNGHKLPQHLGGFLPFKYEVTGLLKKNGNVLAVAVDSRWMNAPPEGSPKGPSSIDYMLPGGITGAVSLRAVPQIFIGDVFAKPVNVLDSRRRLELTCSIDAGVVPSGALRLETSLTDNPRVIASSATDFKLANTGESKVTLSLTGLQGVALWDVSAPKLYNVEVRLFLNGQLLHEYRTRIGFRETRFELNGFFLNGARLQLFGLNRHELYPYMGRAAPIGSCAKMPRFYATT